MEERPNGQCRQEFLERSDEALDDGDAAGFANGAEALTDGVTLTPILESVAGELPPAIRDQVPRRRADFGNHSAEEIVDQI